MYKLKFQGHTSATVEEVLSELTELVHLDISDEPEGNQNSPYPNYGNKLRIQDLLSSIHALPNLVYLDISGKTTTSLFLSIGYTIINS